MAVWAYHDFEDKATYTTVALQLARLNLHIGEVQAAIAADTSKDGASRSSQGLIQYRRDLLERRKELSSQSVNAGGRTFVRFVRAQ